MPNSHTVRIATLVPLALMAVLLVAGCNSKTSPTPENYTQALNAYLLAHSDCLLPATRFPLETSDPAKSQTARLARSGTAARPRHRARHPRQPLYRHPGRRPFRPALLLRPPRGQPDRQLHPTRPGQRLRRDPGHLHLHPQGRPRLGSERRRTGRLPRDGSGHRQRRHRHPHPRANHGRLAGPRITFASASTQISALGATPAPRSLPPARPAPGPADPPRDTRSPAAKAPPSSCTRPSSSAIRSRCPTVYCGSARGQCRTTVTTASGSAIPSTVSSSFRASAAISASLRPRNRSAVAPPKKPRSSRPPSGTRCANFWSMNVAASRELFSVRSLLSAAPRIQTPAAAQTLPRSRTPPPPPSFLRSASAPRRVRRSRAAAVPPRPPEPPAADASKLSQPVPLSTSHPAVLAPHLRDRPNQPNPLRRNPRHHRIDQRPQPAAQRRKQRSSSFCRAVALRRCPH